MKIVAGVLACLFVGTGMRPLSGQSPVAPADESRGIEWSAARKLSRRDFQGVAPASARGSAHSFIRIDVSWSCDSNGLLASVTALFLPRESWWTGPVRSGRGRSWPATDNGGDVQLLEHEQTHFDLAETYARKMRRRLAEVKDPCGAESATQLEAVVQEAGREFDREQELYDEETGHGTRRSAQMRWTVRVRRALE